MGENGDENDENELAKIRLFRSKGWQRSQLAAISANSSFSNVSFSAKSEIWLFRLYDG